MAAENMAIRLRVRTGEIVRQLEALRRACANAAISLRPPPRPGDIWSLEVPIEVIPEDGSVGLAEGHDRRHPVLEPTARRTCTCGRGPWCACGFCQACQGYDFGLPVSIPEAMQAGGNEASLLAHERVFAELRRERARQLDEQMASLLRASHEPAEGPTSACFDCGRTVPPAHLWVGKKSGIPLCDSCMGTWEKAGRARRTGEF